LLALFLRVLETVVQFKGTVPFFQGTVPFGGTKKTVNNVVPMALADIVIQQVNCFLGFLWPGRKKPGRFSPAGVFL
jgi:hypothetical protein